MSTPLSYLFYNEDGSYIKMEVEDTEYEEQAGLKEPETPEHIFSEVKIEEPEEEEIVTSIGMMEQLQANHPEISMREAIYLVAVDEDEQKSFWDRKKIQMAKAAVKEKKEIRRKREQERYKEKLRKEQKKREAVAKRLATIKEKKLREMKTVPTKVQRIEPSRKRGRKATSTTASTSASSGSSSSSVSPPPEIVRPPPAKKSKFTCPDCGKAARGGTCFCNGCGEWVHLKCAQIKAKEWNVEWRCMNCE